MKAKATLLVLLILFVLALFPGEPSQAAIIAPVNGEIERIILNNPADHWSGGTIVVGGQSVIIPRNLLMDLPANRLTLKQLFDQAPAACVALGESGLAKADACNTTGTGGFATISANRTNAGDVIAGDVFIQKGIDFLFGQVTHINHAEGYLMLNGVLNVPNTGVMLRINDPTSRHTIQIGAGCVPGNTANCSPDPRFTLDPDNYTNVFSTGYPLCIPSTVPRTFADALGLGVTSAQALADGSGDVLCPATNRSPVVPELPVADSRRFAPVKVGDTMTAEGNYETINGVRFLSAHTTVVGRALQTQNLPTQPDYLFLEEVEIDAPGFQNQRVRTLFIGFTTRAPADVLIWSLHRDPVTNEAHEFPLGTSIGCDNAAGAGTCTAQGIIGAGVNIFKIRHDADFLFLADPTLDPCAHLNADPRMGSGFCPGGPTLANMFSILSPIPHEIQARTGHALANPGLITIDINGNQATNGQYLFPLGMNLGGIGVPEFVEIDLNAVSTPISFSGIPWNLDRRVGPGGCIDTDGDGAVDCEATPQPLDPFPFEGIDPRNQASTPTGSCNDSNFTDSPLTSARDRILSFVTDTGGGAFNFDGDNTVLAWPPADPPSQLLFSDVPPAHFAFSFITQIQAAGITGGCVVNNLTTPENEAQFCPEAPITRGQMAVFIETSLGNPANPCAGRFADVPGTHPLCGFIERLADDGITGGCAANVFCPDAPITRGQMAVFIETALGSPANACSGVQFADVTAAHPFCGFIERLAADGITSGCGNGNFCPDNPVSRAEMAVFLVAAPTPLLP